MSEAPERVWIGAHYEPLGGVVIGSSREDADATEYVRADLLAETVEALRGIVAGHDFSLLDHGIGITTAEGRRWIVARAVLAKYGSARAPTDEVSHDG
jgi:hypothetical protein